MVRPLLWQNPVRVTRPVPSGRLPLSSTFFTFGRVGPPVNLHSVGRRPLGLRRPFPICRSSSFVSGLATFTIRFRSVDLLRSFPISRSSPTASSLSAFSVRFRSCDLLRLPAIPTLRLVGFCRYEPLDLYTCMIRAYEGFRFKKEWQKLQIRGMSQDFSWHKSALEYLKMYEEVINN
jgi:hypothetical protein